ncbi:hypothetical protein [Planomonospora algeriensis]
MARPLAALRLAQLDAPPSPPPYGYGTVYAAFGGRLGFADAFRPAMPLTPAQLVADTDVTCPFAGAPVPAHDLPVDTGTYYLRYAATYTGSVASTGIRVRLDGPTASKVALQVHRYTSVTACSSTTLTGLGVFSDSSNASNTTTPLPIIIEGMITVALGGTLTLSVASTTSGGTVAWKAGSSLTASWATQW